MVGNGAVTRLRKSTPLEISIPADRRIMKAWVEGPMGSDGRGTTRGNFFRRIVSTMNARRMEEGTSGLGRMASQEVRGAYNFAVRAHEGQTRGKPNGQMTNTPYIFHCLTDAWYYAQLGGDYRGVMAALLHDTIEEGRIRGKPVSLETIRSKFGEVVAGLVDRLTKPKLVSEKWIWATAANFHSLHDEYRERRETNPEIEDQMLVHYWDRIASDPTALVLKMLDFCANLGDIDNLPDERKKRYFLKVAGKMGLLRVLHPPLYDNVYRILESRDYHAHVSQEYTSNTIRNSVVVVPRRQTIVSQHFLEHLPRPTQNNTLVYTNGAQDMMVNGWLEIGYPRRVNGERRARPLLTPLNETLHELRVVADTSQLPTGLELSERMYRVDEIGKGGDNSLTLRAMQNIVIDILTRLRTFHAKHVSNGNSSGYASDRLPKIAFLNPHESLTPVVEYFKAKRIGELV